MPILRTRHNVDSIATKSALSPGLWLTGTVSLVLFPITPLLPVWAAIVGWTIFTIVSLGTFAVFVYHSLTNPSLLRSEEYSLKIQALEMCGDGTKSAADLTKILGAKTISTDGFIQKRIGNE